MKDKPEANMPLKPFEAATASSKIGNLLSGNEGMENFAGLDRYMQSQLNPLASEIIKACLPDGLAVPFPANVSVQCLCLFPCRKDVVVLLHFLSK